VRSKGALRNHGLSPKKRKKVGQKFAATDVYALQAARAVWVEIFRLGRNSEANGRWQGGKEAERGLG
jgi:hypothetical protein